MPKSVTIKVHGVTPISFSRFHGTPEEDRESKENYEKRCWRYRAHADESGNIILPPSMIKNSLAATAKFLSQSIPGKGKKTYTKHFESGTMVTEPWVLTDGEGQRLRVDDLKSLQLFVPSDGIRGSSKRVMRIFPILQAWNAQGTVYILDDTITQDVFERTFREDGKFVGWGSFRPSNNGYYGRFEPVNFMWET